MQQQYQVIAVSADAERLERYGIKNNVRTFPVEMTRKITPIMDLRALLRLYNFLKKEKPLIVHTHTPKAGIVGMLAAKLAKVPIRLHTVAGMPLMENSGVKRIILEAVEKFTYSCATKIYPNSFGLREIISDKKFASHSKVKVLGKGSSNGIDTSFFDPESFSVEDLIKIKKSNKIPQKDLVFVFVGRLVGDKGINELVEAFVQVQEKHKEVSLLLVGPFEQELDPVKESILKVIRNHTKIFSVGYQEDVRPYLGVADILVFPSYREGFPNVVMQAGAMGLPSIVTDINGCNEIIEEGVNGTIIPVKDSIRLGKAMERMIVDQEWRKALKQNAREKITKKYDRRVFWNLLLEEYKLQETLVK